jgi:hypothetical protein
VKWEKKWEIDEREITGKTLIIHRRLVEVNPLKYGKVEPAMKGVLKSVFILFSRLVRDEEGGLAFPLYKR